MGASEKMSSSRVSCCSKIKVRHLIVLMATLCPMVCYISRQNLSMAIVAMVNEDQTQPAISQPTSQLDGGHEPPATISNHHHHHQHQRSTCPFPQQHQQQQRAAVQGTETHNNSTSPPPPAIQLQSAGTAGFDWSSSEQSLVLGAFFWTYVIFQIPAARFAEQIGAKWILATATTGSCLLSLISPWAASLSVYALFLVRALMGICQTALYPACYVLYSHWLPPLERSQALPILCVGAYLGSIVASTSTGYFIQSPDLGWEFAFYVPSVLCAIWSLFWVLIGASEPRQHQSISMQEIEYIESKMETTKRSPNNNNNNTGTHKNKSQKEATPMRKQISWSKLFKSKSIWAMIVAFFSSNWSFSIVLLLLPTYLNDILHIEPLENGMINSTIYILYCISSPIVGSVSTLMVETRPFGLTRLNVRKLFQGVALFGQALCFCLIPLIGCDKTLVLATLFTQIILFSFVNGGEVQLPTELSADFSGTIYAIGNCVGSSTGFIVPSARSLLVSDTLDRHQWANFFYVAALISGLGGLIFVLFGRNELRDYSQTSASNSSGSVDSIGELKQQSQKQFEASSNSNKFDYIYKPSRGRSYQFDLTNTTNKHHNRQLSGALAASRCCSGLMSVRGLSYQVADIEQGGGGGGGNNGDRQNCGHCK